MKIRDNVAIIGVIGATVLAMASCNSSSNGIVDGRMEPDAAGIADATIDAAIDVSSDASRDASIDATGALDAAPNFPPFAAIDDRYAPTKNANGGDGQARAMAISPDGSQLVVVGTAIDAEFVRLTVKLYTGAQRQTETLIDGSLDTLPDTTTNPVAVGFSPSGDSFVVVGYHDSSSALGNDRQWVVKRYSGVNFATIDVIDTAESPVGGAYYGYEGFAIPQSVSFAPDGASFVVGGVANDEWWIRRYSGADFSTVADIELSDVVSGASASTQVAVAFAPDSSSLIAVGDIDQSGQWVVRQYSGANLSTAATLEQSLGVAGAARAAPHCIAFAPDSSFFVVAGNSYSSSVDRTDGLVKKYSGDGFGDVEVIDANTDTGNQTFLLGVAVSPDAQSIAVSGYSEATGNAVLREYTGADFATATTLLEAPLDGATAASYLEGVAFDPLTSQLDVAGFTDAGRWVVQAYTLDQSSTIEDSRGLPFGSSAEAVAVAFSPDGSVVAAVGDDYDGVTSRWLVRTYSGDSFATIDTLDESTGVDGGSAYAFGLAFSPDGQTLVVVGTAAAANGNNAWTVRIYDGAGFQHATTLVDSGTTAASSDAEPSAVQFAPDGSSFVVAGYTSDDTEDWVVKRYSGLGFATADELEVSATLGGGTYCYANGVAFAPDGQSVVAVGDCADSNSNEQWTIRRYSGAGFATASSIATGSPATDATSGDAAAVAFSPDGTSLIVAGSESPTDRSTQRWVARRYSGADLSSVSVVENSVLLPGGELRSEIRGIGFSPDGTALLVTGTTPQSGWVVRQYSGPALATATTVSAAFTADDSPDARGIGIAVAPAGNWFVSSGSEYTYASGNVNLTVIAAQL